MSLSPYLKSFVDADDAAALECALEFADSERNAATNANVLWEAMVGEKEKVFGMLTAHGVKLIRERPARPEPDPLLQKWLAGSFSPDEGEEVFSKILDFYSIPRKEPRPLLRLFDIPFSSERMERIVSRCVSMRVTPSVPELEKCIEGDNFDMLRLFAPHFKFKLDQVPFAEREGYTGIMKKIYVERGGHPTTEDMRFLVEGGHRSAVCHFLSHVASVYQDKFTVDECMSAALKKKENFYIFRLLENRDVDLDASSCYKFSPLASAALYNNIPALDYLVSRGANINLRDGTGTTPLCMVCKRNEMDERSLDTLRALLRLGADPNLDFPIGLIMRKKAYNYEDGVAIRELAKHGAHYNSVNENGHNVLSTLLAAPSRPGTLDRLHAVLEYGVRLPRNWKELSLIANGDMLELLQCAGLIAGEDANRLYYGTGDATRTKPYPLKPFDASDETLQRKRRAIYTKRSRNLWRLFCERHYLDASIGLVGLNLPDTIVIEIIDHLCGEDAEFVLYTRKLAVVARTKERWLDRAATLKTATAQTFSCE